MVTGSLSDRVKHAQETFQKKLWEVEPRFQLLERTKRSNCTAGMFRRKIFQNCSKCQVKHRDYLLHKALDDALVTHLSFLANMRVELKTLFGNVGTNPSMQKLVPAAALCWDWSTLVFARPTPEQGDAFLFVCQSLHSLLRRQRFPQTPEYDCITKSLSSDFARGGALHRQYLFLAARVRAVMLAVERPSSMQARIVPAAVIASARRWVVLGGVIVAPLEFSTSLWKALMPRWHVSHTIMGTHTPNK